MLALDSKNIYVLNSHTVSESASESDDNSEQNHDVWSPSSSQQQQQERSNSFDEFVNNEVAVARAMVDDSYMENLNDAQRKRVERLKAYQKSSETVMGVQIPKDSQTKTISNHSGNSIPSNSSNTSTVAVESVLGHKFGNISKDGKAKSSIPVKDKKNPLSNLHKKVVKTESVKQLEVQTKPQVQMTVQYEPMAEDVSARVLNGGNKQSTLSKPASNQKEQWRKKEQHAIHKQEQTKERGQIEERDAKKGQAEDKKSASSLQENATEQSVKIGDKSAMKSVNDNNMHEIGGEVTSECTLNANAASQSSSEGRTKASKQTKQTQTSEHVQGKKEESVLKQTKLKLKQTGQKVLKFSSNVMHLNSSSTVHSPPTEQLQSKTVQHSIVEQTTHSVTAAEIDQSRLEEELPQSGDTNDDTPSDSAPLFKRRYKITQEVDPDSLSSLNDRGQTSHDSKSNKRPTQAHGQRMINAAAIYTDDSESDESSPEHSAHCYAGIRSRPINILHVRTKFTSRGGGGYGAAYAKRRETNRNRIIRVKQYFNK